MSEKISCSGFECPIRNQCKRFTHRSGGRVIRKCTNRRFFLQDEERVNGDCQRW